MSLYFLPSSYTRVTETTIAVPVPPDMPDLPDLGGRWPVAPTRVEMELRVIEGGPTGDSTVVSVTVYGSRCLKTGGWGKETSSSGWESAVNKHWHGEVEAVRPDWLTDLIAANIPADWDRALLDLPGGAA